MKEKAKKIIDSMKVKVKYLGKDLDKLDKTLEEVNKNE